MTGWKVWLANETWLAALVFEPDLEKAEELALAANPGAVISSKYAPIEVDAAFLKVEAVKVGSVKTVKTNPDGTLLLPEPGAPARAF